MCGILAVLHFGGESVDKNLISRMRDTMYHRGPDDAGIYIKGPVGLAHRRLSIIDLSETGHQPMTNEDGSLWLVFNGEIYNYVELMSDLKKKGHTFHSVSDTEVILHQYEEDGENCLHKFNGMFAFVIWDVRAQKLFAARDRLGIKPLYYYADSEKVIFASEIKAIIENPGIARTPDFQALADYLFAGRAIGDKTMFKGVREIEPGYLATVYRTGRTVCTRKYWDVIYDYDHSRTDYKLKDELFHLLDDAVKVHCRSDAPLGCHLSGGYDSSTIVALTAQHRAPLKTFSIKFSDDKYIDETRYAKAVARHVGADYHETSPTAADMGKLLPYLMWHMDVPMATEGGFAYYTVSRMAKNYVKVSLTGHGGDEIFAGYPAQFQACYNRTDMLQTHADPDRTASRRLGRRILYSLLYKSLADICRSLRNRISKKERTLEDVWVQLHCGHLPDNKMVFHPDFTKALRGYSPRDDYVKPFREVNAGYPLDKCLYHDLRTYLPGLLHLEDRVSMSVSLESRVPLLDYRIVELLATVPPEQKIKEFLPKYLLRGIASRLLPAEVSNRRDKLPFPVPGKFWTTPEMHKLMRLLLLSPDSMKRGIFTKKVLKDASRNINTIWPIINIELWFKIFIDKDPYWLDKSSIKV